MPKSKFDIFSPVEINGNDVFLAEGARNGNILTLYPCRSDAAVDVHGPSIKVNLGPGMRTAQRLNTGLVVVSIGKHAKFDPNTSSFLHTGNPKSCKVISASNVQSNNIGALGTLAEKNKEISKVIDPSNGNLDLSQRWTNRIPGWYSRIREIDPKDKEFYRRLNSTIDNSTDPSPMLDSMTGLARQSTTVNVKEATIGRLQERTGYDDVEALLYAKNNELKQFNSLLNYVDTDNQGNPFPNEPDWRPVAIPYIPSSKEYENMLEPGYFRIGYAAFNLPPENIIVNRSEQLDMSPLLRSKGSVKTGFGHNDNNIQLKFSLSDSSEVNSVLLPLIRQFHKTPFVPVINSYLNDTLDIDALSLEAIQVSTVQGYPGVLDIMINASPFYWRNYMPSSESFDETICYPIYKIWCETKTKTQPLADALTGDIKFFIPNELYLKTLNTMWDLRSEAMLKETSEKDKTGIVQAVDWAVNGDTTVLDIYGPGSRNSGISGAEYGNKVFAGDLLCGTFTIGVDGGGAIPAASINNEEGVLLRLQNPKHALAGFSRADAVIYDGAIGDSGYRIGHGGVGITVGVENRININTLRGVSNEIISEKIQLLGTVTRSNDGRDLTDEETKGKLTALYQELPNYYFFFKKSNINKSLSRLAKGYSTKDKETTKKKLDTEKSYADRLASLETTQWEQIIFDSMVVEHITTSAENTVVKAQSQGTENPSQQFLGSSDTFITISGTINDETDVEKLNKMFDKLDYLTRRYRGAGIGTVYEGYMWVTNELFSLMGVSTVLPINCVVRNQQNFPGTFEFEISFVQFELSMHKREELKSLEIQEVEKNNPQKSSDEYGNHMIRAERLHDKLRTIELYPDMQLPTYLEVGKWVEICKQPQVVNTYKGVKVSKTAILTLDEFPWAVTSEDFPWTADDCKDLKLVKCGNITTEDKLAAYVDPDFYCVPGTLTGNDLIQSVLTSLTTAAEVPGQLDLQGQRGETGTIKFGTRIELNKDPVTIQVQADYDAQAKKAREYLDKMINVQNYNIIDMNYSITSETKGGIEKLKKANLETIIPLVTKSSINRKVPFEIAATLFSIENNGNKLISSKSSARGYGQMLKATSTFMQTLVPITNKQVQDPRDDPAWAVDASTLYLKRHHDNAVSLLTGKKYNKNIHDANVQVDTWRYAILCYRVGAGAAKTLLSNSNGDVAMAIASSTADNKYKQFMLNLKPEDLYQSPNWLLNAQSNTSSLDITSNKLLNTLFGKKPTATVEPNKNRTLQEILTELNSKPKVTKKDPRVSAGNPIIQSSPDAEKNIDPAIEGQLVRVDPKTNKAVSVTALYMLRMDKSRDRDVSQIPGGYGNVTHNDNKVVVTYSTDKLNDTKNTIYNLSSDTKDFYSTPKSWPFKGRFRKEEDSFFGDEFYIVPANFDISKSPEEVAGLASRPKAQLNIEKLPSSKESGDLYGQGSYYCSFFDAFVRPDGRDMFYDMRHYEPIGRLLQAFPTYCLLLVDGGRWLRFWRLYDHWYGMTAVRSIEIHRTRKGPIDTAVVSFSNMFNYLTRLSGENPQIEELKMRWGLPYVWRGIKQMAFASPNNDDTQAAWGSHVKAMFMKAGSRLHIRLGYGSNANKIPVVFNGVITEVPIAEEVVQVVALSDGVELVKNIINGDASTTPGDPNPRYKSVGFMGLGIEPRNAILRIMSPWNPVEVITKGGYLARNPYGIEHFGAPTYYNGSKDAAEIGMNIYRADKAAFTAGYASTDSTAYENITRSLGLGGGLGNGETLIGISIDDATPWKVIDTCTKVAPEYICAVHPFELRSTLFYGKPYWAMHFEYSPDYLNILSDSTDVLGSVSKSNYPDNWDPQHPEKVTHFKPYAQVHLISSMYNLVSNTIRAHADDIYTICQGVGTYNGTFTTDDVPDYSSMMYLDTDIYPEHQKILYVKSGLYSTTGQNIVEGNSTLNPALWTGLFTRKPNNNYAISALRETVKDMYGGSVLILGNAAIKPYDKVYLCDLAIEMVGLIEVKDVTHHLSYETGFMTTVSPDLVCSFADQQEQTSWGWISMLGHRILGVLALQGTLGALSNKLAKESLCRALLSGVAKLKNIGAKEAADGLKKTLFKSIADTKAGQAAAGIGTKIQAGSAKAYDAMYDWVAKTTPGFKTWVMSFKPETPAVSSRIMATVKPVQDKVAPMLDKLINYIKNLRFVAACKRVGRATTRIGVGAVKGVASAATAAREAGVGEKVTAFKAAWKAAANESEDVMLAARALKGVGNIAKVAKSAIWVVLTCGLVEWVNRSFAARQALILCPLLVGGRKFVAGINGHMGCVIGDHAGYWDGVISSFTSFDYQAKHKQGWVGTNQSRNDVMQYFIGGWNNIFNAEGWRGAVALFAQAMGVTPTQYEYDKEERLGGSISPTSEYWKVDEAMYGKQLAGSTFVKDPNGKGTGAYSGILKERAPGDYGKRQCNRYAYDLMVKSGAKNLQERTVYKNTGSGDGSTAMRTIMSNSKYYSSKLSADNVARVNAGDFSSLKAGMLLHLDPEHWAILTENMYLNENYNGKVQTSRSLQEAIRSGSLKEAIMPKY